MLTVFLFGIASGLPIMVLYKTIKIWMSREGISLESIGYFSWVTIPYSVNFLWAFVFDRFVPIKYFGRRRSWLLLIQAALIVNFVVLSQTNPHQHLQFLVGLSFLLCFLSASQDVVIDAYRREILSEAELSIGSSLGVYGYRVGMLIASGLGLWLVDKDTLNLGFDGMFLFLAFIMLICFFIAFFVREPEVQVTTQGGALSAIWAAFSDIFRRKGIFLLLTFIIMFKLGDAFAGSMLGDFYVKSGFSNKEIAEITSGLGFFSSLGGMLVGGFIIFNFGYQKPLIIFGVLQALSTAGFAILTHFPGSLAWLSALVFLEDFSGGLGTSALVGYMASLTSIQFTAIQYSLFASLASVGRTFFAGFSGKAVAALGYQWFFIASALVAIPGIVLLFFIDSMALKPSHRKT